MNRKPVVAGRFYPGSKEQCINEIKECLEKEPLTENIENKISGGIVPHAGWIYSGSTAGLVFQAIKKSLKDPLFIIFGAVHVYGISGPSIFKEGYWETPLGNMEIDENIAMDIINEGKGLIIADENPHRREHSIEVQIPFIQYLFPGAKMVPIMVPPDRNAVKTGEIVGKVIAGYKDRDIVVIGSTDMTHYGFNYDLFTKGKGKEALEWVKNENDKKLVDLMIDMKSDDVIPEANKNHSACGAGAISATISAVKLLGASRGHLLKYTTSYDEYPDGEPSSFVGYTGMVFTN
jgi:hypothetical protein